MEKVERKTKFKRLGIEMSIWVMREMGMNDVHACMRIGEWVEDSGFRR